MGILEHTAPANGAIVTADVHSHLEEDVKAAIDHVEDSPRTVEQLTAALAALPRSAFVHQGPWQAIRTFRRQFLIGVLASVGAL